MSAIYQPSEMQPAKIVCEKIGAGLQVSMESLNMSADAGVLICVGESHALISRNEIAAAAALWPVQKKS